MRIMDELIEENGLEEELEERLIDETGNTNFWLGEHESWDEGSDQEDPEAALRNGPLRLAASLLGMHRSPAAQEEEEAESAVLRQLQGIGTLPLLKAFVTVPLKCSGAILRRTGPDRTSPLDRDPDGARSHRRPATTAHIDQDVEGEPLRAMGVSQLFRSLPWLRLLNV